MARRPTRLKQPYPVPYRRPPCRKASRLSRPRSGAARTAERDIDGGGVASRGDGARDAEAAVAAAAADALREDAV